ncbi:DNA helicase II [Thiotrichales bacterium 19S3-7]|nr:DNA helicase II [Thiotrichales bacterium 19S3-7]MCF6802316.1 DNA helicase II [Thiotrichales bacterium 19S3-11]
MDNWMTTILSGLNKPQKEAVIAASHNTLVLAGAGSGKTRVLTHRIAYLCKEQSLSPLEILAVTFTNKAANEMRGRVESLLNVNPFGMWIGTFHGIAHRLLRRHGDQIGLDRKFRILDQDEQLQVIKRLLKNMQIDDSFYPPKTVQQFINARKDDGIRATELSYKKDSRFDCELIRIYHAYELQLKADKALDFADLLLYAYQLWKAPSVLEHYQNRFKAILVDEFQDTNDIQYRWLKALVNETNHIMVVGDDDQSIYGWRGAKVENIFKFKQEFAPVEIIRLEQNYRSTQVILNAANGIIKHNDQRMGKQLWSEGNQGDKLKLYEALDERDEALFIAGTIQNLIESKAILPSSIAILYRSNAQSRVLEEALLQKQIPYRIYGGLRFFERAEIKDALAYLRLLVLREDNVAFERIINTPTRGIGLKTVEKLREIAREKEISLWQSALELSEDKRVTSRTRANLIGFVKLIEHMSLQLEDYSLKEKIRFVLEASGLMAMYRNDKKEIAKQKLENLEELVNAANEFIPMVAIDVNENDLLEEFLTFAVLESGEGRADEFTSSVQLMTLHSAKGLEFPYVFISGLEEGLFPSHRAQDEDRLSEERRLCYVGITRAMQQLYLSYARVRHQYGDINYQKKSRFIQEIPEALIEEVRLRQTHAKSQFGFGFNSSVETNTSVFNSGDLVSHHKFGIGVFIKEEGIGDQRRYIIDFKGGHGVKTLLARMIELEKI